MRELHLFAGAGGGILGGMLLGHTCVCAVELEPYCRDVLLQRQRDGILPRFPIWDDVRTFDGKPWRGRVDVVCGGFPCTDVSHFGSRSERLGLDGERSGLWHHMARIVEEVGPALVFIENTPQIRYRGLDVIVRDLASLGYDCAWDVFSAREVGAPHERKRLWCLAWHTDGAHARAVVTVPRKDAEPVGTCWWTKERESRIPRMDDGVADRLDRFRAVGNGQLPAVVVRAWRMLMPLDTGPGIE